jgi:hypothetical protein
VDVIKVPIEAHAVPEFSLFAYVLAKSAPWKADLGSETEDELTVKPLLEFRPLLLGQSYRGEVTFSVKKPGALLAKKTLSVENGSVITADPALTVRVQKDEELYVEYHFAGGPLDGRITRHDAQVTGKNTEVTLTAGLHTTLPGNDNHEDVIFGPLYRGWGHFAWNGNGDRATQSIDQTLLKVSEKAKKQEDKEVDASMSGDKLKETDPFDPATERFVILGASGKHQRWQGYDNEVYVAASLVSCSRQGEDDLSAVKVNTGTGVTGTGAPGIDKISKVNTYAYTLGQARAALAAAPASPRATQRVVTDFMDMNGDRYPDVVTEKIIQYSSATGGLSGRVIASGGDKPEDLQRNRGRQPFGLLLDSRPQVPQLGQECPEGIYRCGRCQVHGRQRQGLGQREHQRGDGYQLRPVQLRGHQRRRLARPGEPAAARWPLNLGYGFAEEEAWNFEHIQDGGSATMTGGAGLGFTKGNNSVSAGFSLARSDNFSQRPSRTSTATDWWTCCGRERVASCL